MSTQEIPLTLTPQQAAQGVVLPLQLPTGPAQLVVPPCRHGELVAARLGADVVHVRVTVAGGPQEPVPKAGIACCLVPFLVVGAVVAFFLLRDDGDDRAGSPGPAPVTTSASSPFPTFEPEPTPTAAPTVTTRPPVTPTAAPTEEEPDPYKKGTCLNGSLPDSTTAQSVQGVEEVPCSAKDAHYKVIQTFPFTSDMNRCSANPRTQYAFSHRYTMNGATISEYVYCLVGIGSYAR